MEIVTVEHRRAMTVGLVLAVTTFAFDALAVSAAMPAIVRDLGGVRLYGAAFSAFMLANLFGLAVSGSAADARGPRPVLAVGLAAFAIGLVVAGTAQSMGVLVFGRAIQGLGAGSIGSSAYVVIGRAFPPEQRPRMFAILSAAWIVPALVAPGLAGAVADHASWRWVFLGLLPFPVIAAVLALPSLGALRPADPPPGLGPGVGARAAASAQLVAGTALVVGGLDTRSVLVAAPLVAAGVLIALPSLGRLLPAGTLRAAGVLPAIIAVRALLNWAFFGADAFIPLAVTSVRDRSNLFAGLALTTSSLSWTAAAWFQARWADRWGDRSAVRTGLIAIGVGTAVTALALRPDVPVATVFIGWSIAGAGMGIAFNTTSVGALAEAQAGAEGTTSASLQLADALGIALATGIAGAIIAAGAREGWAVSRTLLGVFAVTAAALVPAYAAAGRIRATPAAAVPAPAAPAAAD